MSVTMNRLQELLAALVAIALITAEAFLLYTGKSTDSFGAAIPVLISWYFAAKVYQVAASPSTSSATVPVTSGTTTTVTTQSCDTTTAPAVTTTAPAATSAAAAVPATAPAAAAPVSPVAIAEPGSDTVA